LTTIILKKGNKQIIRETVKPVKYNGKVLRVVDFTDTTAMQEFCSIQFKDREIPTQLIPQHRINVGKYK